MQRSDRAHVVDTRVIARSFRAGLGVPLHRQLEVALRGLIRDGEVRVGDVLPGEHELASGLGVSRHTIRHALGVLAGEGLLRRARGRRGGTSVLAPPSAAPAIERTLDGFYAFAWEMRARGAEHRSYVLERTQRPAAGALAERLALPAGAPVERIVRVRTADGEPLVLETTHLPQRLTAGLEPAALERGSLYDALEQLHGITVVRARETLRPIVVRRPVARLLGVRPGTPAFAVERLTFAREGPIEWQESIVRGDRYTYSVELTRAGGHGSRP
jgi:GntR family transcriptional regulator